MGLAVSVLFVWSLINCLKIHNVAWMNNVASLVQVVTIISLVVVLLSRAPRLNSVGYVLTDFQDETGFGQTYYTVILSILFPLYGYAGYDGPAHLAEETKGSSSAAPLGILYTVLATGVLGLLLILVLLLALQDLTDALNGDSGNAVIQIISQNCGHRTASLFAWSLVVNIFFCGSSSVTVTSRIWFALCRDKATIYSDLLSTVDPYFRSPVNGIIFMFFVTSSLLMIPLNGAQGEDAFISIIGLTVVGLQVSYGIPILMKVLSMVWPSRHGNIADKLTESRMSLRQWSLPLGLVSCVWVCFSTLVLLLPTTYPITTGSMNFTCVAICFIIVLGTLNWQFHSKHTFKGPPRDDDVYNFQKGDFFQSNVALFAELFYLSFTLIVIVCSFLVVFPL